LYVVIHAEFIEKIEDNGIASGELRPGTFRVYIIKYSKIVFIRDAETDNDRQLVISTEHRARNLQTPAIKADLWQTAIRQGIKLKRWSNQSSTGQVPMKRGNNIRLNMQAGALQSLPRDKVHGQSKIQSATSGHLQLLHVKWPSVNQSYEKDQISSSGHVASKKIINCVKLLHGHRLKKKNSVKKASLNDWSHQINQRQFAPASDQSCENNLEKIF
jgi:hypothetical protein